MHKVNLKLLMLLVILASCEFPTISPKEQCIVDLQNQGCYCRTYVMSEDYVGPRYAKDDANDRRQKRMKIGKKSVNVIEMPFMHCHKLVGFVPSVWGEVVLWIKSIFIWKKKFNK